MIERGVRAAKIGLADGEKKNKSKESFEPIPFITAWLTYMGFYFLMLLGFLNQLLFTPKVATERNRDVSHALHAIHNIDDNNQIPLHILMHADRAHSKRLLSVCRFHVLIHLTVFYSSHRLCCVFIGIFQGYAPLYDSFEQFYLRYVYRRIRDCFNRPICSVPGAEVTLKDRITKDRCWTFE